MKPGADQLGDFHFGAAVYASDGEHIGALRRLIVDQESLDLHAIVVKESHRFSGESYAGFGLLEDDIAVPIASVANVTRDRVDLAISGSEARQTEPYLTYQYAPIDSWKEVGMQVVANVGQQVRVPQLDETAAKRADEMEINPGEHIMLGNTGRKLGTVRDVVVHDGEFIGVVMHPEGFFKEDVLLQVRFLGRSDDAALFARLTDEDLSQLEPFHPKA